MKSSQKSVKHSKGAFRARSTLQKFEYSVLGHMGALFPHRKRTQKKTFKILQVL